MKIIIYEHFNSKKCDKFIVNIPLVLLLIGASVKNKVERSPTRPVENVVLTKKGLQERNIQMLDATTVEKIGKIIN
jgi:hypothetical protein